MQTLLKRIQVAIGTGTVLCLAGGGCDDLVTRPHAFVDAASDAAMGLAPYPLSALGCASSDASISSLCCHFVICFSLDAGSTCPAIGDPTAALNIPIGQAGCEASGPFAPNLDDPNLPAGECCYVDGSIPVSVDGRPLIVDHVMLVAPVVMRSDWFVG